MTNDNRDIPKDHGEPPRFVKWLIWLFRKKTWVEQPLVATVAALITLFVSVSGVYGGITFFTNSTSSTGPKTVILMDSPLPQVVYDKRTLSTAGTNADDISDIIDDLPILVIKETTSLNWDREEQVLQLEPDLVIIHLSAFYDSTNPLDSDRKLDTFFKFIASSESKLIVYTRVFSKQLDRAKWIRNLERTIPKLRGRVVLIHIEGKGSASFRDTKTAKKIKLIVKQTLEL